MAIERVAARRLLERVQRASLRAATREQHLADLARTLVEIVPDISDQYTCFIPDAMETVKVRAQHAFQVALAMRAVDLALAQSPAASRPFTVVDVGDSSGTHTQYLRSLVDRDPRVARRTTSWISVNLDPVAIEKIRGKGLHAILSRAEDLHYVQGMAIDLFLSFEMLEHLSDPVSFLDSLSLRGGAEWLAVTVPYVRHSRVGLHHIRRGKLRTVLPENTHICEFSPSDWRLLFKHAGWSVAEERIYRQYPRWGFWRVMQPVWRALDFEGFYGVILRRDRAWADCYKTGAESNHSAA